MEARRAAIAGRSCRVDHIAIDRMTRRSPPLSRNVASTSRLPCDRIVSTPASDTPTPASCSGGEPLAQEQPRQRDDHHRNERIEDDAVRRRRVVEAEIGERVVGADADRAENDHRLPARLHERPFAAHVGPCERREDHQREEPAKERHRHRRNVGGESAADNPVARPEQRRQHEQQIGVRTARCRGRPVHATIIARVCSDH